MKNQSIARLRGGVRGLLSLIAALTLAFVLVGVLHLYAGDEAEVELKGTVFSRPDEAAGYGQWLVRGVVQDETTPRVYTVTVDADTKFGHGLPRIGDSVKVKGELSGPDEIYAQEVEREDDAGTIGEYENKGQVLERPASADGVGLWQLGVDSGAPLTVTADAQTRFSRGVPAVGQWVEVKGRLQSDGSVLAERMRVDDFEADELIVRLLPGVSPTALTARHPLTLVQSILISANIHLFASPAGEEVEDELVQKINTQDTDIVAWAEVNYAGGIPEGNPYDIWEWGGQEASGYVNQFAFDQIHLTSAAITVTGDGLVVAVIDSGVSLSHPALLDHLLAGVGPGGQ